LAVNPKVILSAGQMKKVHDNLYSQKLFPGHDKIPKNKRAVQKNTEDSYN